MSRRSIIGYYGGKSRMSPFISERLDYSHTSTYIEMFGGGARVLLNKPRHANEIYSDYSTALTALMGVMADEKLSREFIYRLRDTECSQGEFDRAKQIVDFVDTDPLNYYHSQMLGELKKIFVKYGILPANSTKKDLIDHIKKNEKPNKKFSKQDLSYLAELYSRYAYVREQFEEDGFLPGNQALPFSQPYSDMDIAVAAYVVYTQSRDCMGQYWSKSKFKNNEAYYNHMSGLYDCAERMQGVEVFRLDAMTFFERLYHSSSNPDDIFSIWMDREDVMMYADPSYISPVHEAKILEKIDWKKADCISDAIKKQQPKDLGKTVYAKSFSYIQQEDFLRCIVNAKCRMMVSNYDLILYNKYLNEDTGWKKHTFKTITTVGNKKDNKRVECIWINY